MYKCAPGLAHLFMNFNPQLRPAFRGPPNTLRIYSLDHANSQCAKSLIIKEINV
jgi:hypothetical protein